MGLIRIPKSWEIPEREATPEDAYTNRRQFLRTMGLASIGAMAVASGACNTSARSEDSAMRTDADPSTFYEPSHEAVQTGRVKWDAAYLDAHPGTRNEKYVLDRNLTRESIAASYNNFYEFTTAKDRVWRRVHAFEARPWTIRIGGLVEKEFTVDIEALVKQLGVEERLYRHRCVEAWAMAVPWAGIPMRKLVEYAQPLSSARHVRMVSFHRPEQAPGVKEAPWYPWPYFEGLTMEEATNELTLLATGIYGHPLPKQHGAPIRLVTPWKYGFKSIKSIVEIEFTEERPKNFWNVAVPNEYGFFANVDPTTPHPRWSQASERLIGTDLKVETKPYNGYGEYVAHLYS